MVDQSGWSLLHKAIQRGEGLLSTLLCIARLFPAKMYQLCYCVKKKCLLSSMNLKTFRLPSGDEFASIFLIRHSAQVNAATVGAVETPLHLVCSFSPKKHSAEVMSGMARITEALLKAGANPNMQNSKGR